MFQSTHPRRVWQCDMTQILLNQEFQSTHPRRVWLVLFLGTVRLCLFQSTHPRRVWLNAIIVSISVLSFNPHTHAGCDSAIWLRSFWIRSFNPHTHAGCDCVISRHCQTMSVSIHTPTQGVTQARASMINAEQFQSTHPRRVWQILLDSEAQQILFQSTHPRRVWPLSYLIIHKLGSFNPHTHAGCDHILNTL